MNVRRLLISAVVALLTLGGCGGAADPTAPDGKTPAGKTGVLVVNQSGTAAARTVWYVRIETMKARPVVEASFPGRNIVLSRDLAPGRYRVVSWWRTCQSRCPASGEKGLGPLEQVCGAPVTVTRGRQVDATVEIRPDGCTVSVR